MTTEDYISFDTAKLLKEKGFNDVPVYTYYLSYGGFYLSPMAVTNKQLYAQGHIAAPTLQMAMKWLREVHKIDMWVECHNKRYKGYIHSEQRGDEALFYEDSYETACEETIKYCLENLI